VFHARLRFLNGGRRGLRDQSEPPIRGRNPDKLCGSRCPNRRPVRERDCSACPRRNVRSCETNSIVPSKSFRASISISFVATLLRVFVIWRGPRIVHFPQSSKRSLPYFLRMLRADLRIAVSKRMEKRQMRLLAILLFIGSLAISDALAQSEAALDHEVILTVSIASEQLRIPHR
jgi:hypothetical protein